MSPIIVTIVLLFSLIFAASAFRYNYVDPRIYSFGFTGIRPGSFFDGEKLTGARVELMKQVCCRAAKRCDAALVPYDKCIDGNNLSPVLDNRWHDVCIEHAATPRRKATFEFSNITFFDIGRHVLVVRENSTITVDDLRNPRNNIKLAFLSNEAFEEVFGLKVFQKEFFVRPENVIPIPVGNPSEGTNEVLKLINDQCISGVDKGEIVGFVSLQLIDPKFSFKFLTELGNPVEGVTMMVRKDEQGILDWWDYTLKKFMRSPDYAKFCETMDQQFGENPINCPDPSQVDCIVTVHDHTGYQAVNVLRRFCIDYVNFILSKCYGMTS